MRRYGWVCAVLAAGALTVPATAVAAPGDLDPTFGPGSSGFVVNQLSQATPASFGSNLLAAALQPDGKIVAAGIADDSAKHAALLLARYMPDGSLDPSFGSGGTGATVIQFGDPSDQFGSFAQGIALQPDGRILVAGNARDASNASQALVARFTSTGQLDPSFGSGGKVIAQLGSSPGSELLGVALQPDGKIVATGDAPDPSGHAALVVERLLTNGMPDSSFATGGVLVTNVGQGSVPFSLGERLVVLPDGHILLGGVATDTQSPQRDAFMLARITAGGQLDPSFGTGGVTINQMSSTAGSVSEATGLAVQSDGRIVEGGAANEGTNSEMAVARYSSLGFLDGSFGNGGRVLSQPSPAMSPFSTGFDLALQPNGRILLAGNAADLTGKRESAIARYNADGSLDSAFGTFGFVLRQFGVGSGSQAPLSQNTVILVQPDGKILAGGTATDSNGVDAAFLVRYVGDPPTPGPSPTPSPGSSPPGPAGPAPPGGGTPLARAAILGLSLTNSVFADGPASTPLTGTAAATRHKRGTTFVIALDRPATLTIAIQRKLPGRRVGRSCRAPSAANRSRRSCIRTQTVARLTRTGHAGSNRVAFSGRIAGHALKAGSYSAAATATNAAGASAPRQVTFRIVTR